MSMRMKYFCIAVYNILWHCFSYDSVVFDQPFYENNKTDVVVYLYVAL